MLDRSDTLILRYGWAVISIAVAIAVRLLLDPILGDKIPYPTVLLAVMFTAWVGGFGPAAAATLLGGIAAVRLLIPPRDSFAIEGSDNQAGLVLYLASGFGIALLGGAMREAQRRAEQNARELLAKQKEVERAEEQIRVTLASIGDAVISTDAAGRVTFMNPAAAQATGWCLDDAAGKLLPEVFNIINATTRAPVDNPVTKVLREGVIVGLANHTLLIARDGAERPIDDSAAPIRDPSGRLVGVVLVFRDITDRKRAEEAFDERLRLLELSAQVGLALTHEDTLRGMLQHCAEAIVRNLNGAFARIWTLDASEQVLELQASAGLYTHLDGPHSRVPVGKFKIGMIAAERKPHLTNAVLGDVRVPEQEWAQREGLVAFAGYPLIVEDRLVGVMAMFARQPLSDATLAAMASVANGIGLGVERKKSEIALAGAERRFKAVFNQQFQFMAILTPDGTVLEANETCFKTTGVRPHQVLGQPIWETPWWGRLPAMQEQWKRHILQAASGGGAVTSEMDYSLADGTPQHATVVVTGLKDEANQVTGILVEGQDDTVRIQYETALRQSERQNRFLSDVSAALVGSLHYQSILQEVAALAVPTLGDCCFFDVLTDDGKLDRVAWKHVDPAKEQLFRNARSFTPSLDSENHPVSKALRSGQPELIAEVSDDWLQSIAPSIDYLSFLRELQIGSMLAVPILIGDRRLGALIFAHGDSQRRHTADDLHLAAEIARRLALMIENTKLFNQLREADRKKNEFLAVLAHELRNPLAPISIGLDLMQVSAGKEEELAPMRDMMKRQVQQMVHLIDDLLDVSRITSGKIVLRKERLDLSVVVNNALDASRPLIEAAKHELILSVPAEPIAVEGDRTRLAQVLSNLLANSAKYTPEGGRVWLAISKEDHQAILRVRDTGIGIPAEMLPLIFEMFTQVDRNLGRAQGGLGIGLALVRSLVEMHAGTVEVRSEGAGKGSEFVVRLPLAAEELNRPAVNGEQGAGREQNDVPPKRRILVVDDNKDAGETLRLLLKVMGNEVRVAHDGPSALEAAATFRPQVVLLDIGLPGMSGHDVARRMRQMPEVKDAVLVAQTGWGQEEDKRKSEEAGFNAHLVKPVDAVALRRLLADMPAAWADIADRRGQPNDNRRGSRVDQS